MKIIVYTTCFLAGVGLLMNCNDSNSSSQNGPYSSQEIQSKLALGERLFFDKRLSKDQSISCASCHNPNLAFTDGLSKSEGVNHAKSLRNAPTLFFLKSAPYFMYDGGVPTLEQQVLVPLQDPHEMSASLKDVVDRLRKDHAYQEAAQKLFRRSFDPYVLTRSIATFVRNIKAKETPFDKFWSGDSAALSVEEKRGWKIFSEKLYCTKCHVPPLFTNYSFQNNGLVPISSSDLGRYRIDGKSESKGKFKVPSLRFMSLTAPYMHDGSYKNMEEVVVGYASGGIKSDNQSVVIQSFKLSNQDKKALVRFLKTL